MGKNILYSQIKPITIGFDQRQNILENTEIRSQSTMNAPYIDPRIQELNRHAKSSYL